MDNSLEYDTIKETICQENNTPMKKYEQNLNEVKSKIDAVVKDIMSGISKQSVEESLNTTTINSGIYLIINKVNGKWYVGSSKNLNRRWNEHSKKLNNNCHYNNHLQYAWNNYGSNSFIFIKLHWSVVLSVIMKSREQLYLNYAKTIKKNVYNILFSACHYHKKSVSEETKMKLRGRKMSEKQKQSISKANKGRKLSTQHCERIRQGKLGNKNPNFGKCMDKVTNAAKLINAKSIIQIDKNGNIIKEYDSMIEATKELNLNEGSISRVCSGKIKHTRGLIFRYK